MAEDQRRHVVLGLGTTAKVAPCPGCGASVALEVGGLRFFLAEEVTYAALCACCVDKFGAAELVAVATELAAAGAKLRPPLGIHVNGEAYHGSSRFCSIHGETLAPRRIELGAFGPGTVRRLSCRACTDAATDLSTVADVIHRANGTARPTAPPPREPSQRELLEAQLAAALTDVATALGPVVGLPPHPLVRAASLCDGIAAVTRIREVLAHLEGAANASSGAALPPEDR